MLLQIFPPSVCTHFFIYLICRMHSLCPAMWSKHRQGIEKNVKGRLHNSLCSYQVTWRLNNCTTISKNYWINVKNYL
ncbi:hypothetical protein I3760_01G078900 [Carya illinoinensis]|nr:hypothetical protein I3760_01G078900 [Carya illinoinensis]